MNKVDIRKIYVGEILKQGEVFLGASGTTSWHDIPVNYYTYEWGYEGESQYGLFVKSVGGYKHILTDTIYPKPSKHTEFKYVINPDNIEKLTKVERALCSHLIEKYQSFHMDSEVLNLIENRLNHSMNEIEEDEYEM